MKFTSLDGNRRRSRPFADQANGRTQTPAAVRIADNLPPEANTPFPKQGAHTEADMIQPKVPSCHAILVSPAVEEYGGVKSTRRFDDRLFRVTGNSGHGRRWMIAGECWQNANRRDQ